MSDGEGLGILEVKSHLEQVFKGCNVVVPATMGGSHHASVSFYEYEIRIILSGRRVPGRPIHFRFMQRAKDQKGRTTKFIINELKTTNPQELTKAINEAKEYLLGIVYAIKSAFADKPVERTASISDLLRGD